MEEPGKLLSLLILGRGSLETIRFLVVAFSKDEEVRLSCQPGTSVLKVLWQELQKGTAGREIKEIHTECMCVWRVWCIWQRQTWDRDVPPRKATNAIWHSVFSQPARPCLHARVGCMQMSGWGHSLHKRRLTLTKNKDWQLGPEQARALLLGSAQTAVGTLGFSPAMDLNMTLRCSIPKKIPPIFMLGVN